jgi:class 3 adenylate cyclase
LRPCAAFRSFNWQSVLAGVTALRVRMGMHTGEPIIGTHPNGERDYFGPTVNRAARLSAQ